MCGRFTLTVLLEEIFGRLGVVPLPYEYMPKYNAAPGQAIHAIIEHRGERRIGTLRWGLIPSWAKDDKIGFKTINAKAETLQDKPSFRNSFQRKRCLIPADGFYEWKKLERGKQPMRITRKDGGLFAMAGLYDTWISPEGGKISTVTIITTPPNELVQPIHNRMPAILTPASEAIWLDRNISDPNLLSNLLVPYPAEEMTAYPVHPRVGQVANDDPECIGEWK
ncbi:SOS response-associated peptidase [Paenibacillus sp. J2TS4]|uniref:SOS response-associated peptidase n=1 Tax=Paenibacillus sp. J2TS4 TaxID=2807194 RepID=UPI001B027F9A|nr:SOS response-associated peptidase [Paenibacillus sp. J2TS4]GIP35414.1 putative SOS response-associated peptidase YoqW [Paenibacillus sp. J2TS4]